MTPERATMIRFEPVMRERGTDFDTVFTHQHWDKPFGYVLLDSFIQHQIADKQDATSSGAHSHEHPTMNRHIRL